MMTSTNLARESPMSRLILGLLAVVFTVGWLLADPASAGKLTLTWTDNAANETGQDIERCLVVNPATSCLNFVVSPPLATVGANATSYVDLAVVEGAVYCYRLRAKNAAGVSGYSNTGCGTVAVTIPADPTGLIITLRFPGEGPTAWQLLSVLTALGIAWDEPPRGP